MSRQKQQLFEFQTAGLLCYDSTDSDTVDSFPLTFSFNLANFSQERDTSLNRLHSCDTGIVCGLILCSALTVETSLQHVPQEK